VTVTPLPSLKRNTWYYGVRCACQRVLALCEDVFEGRGDETQMRSPVELAVKCDCGTVTAALMLTKFKTP